MNGWDKFTPQQRKNRSAKGGRRTQALGKAPLWSREQARNASAKSLLLRRLAAKLAQIQKDTP